jgi:hypothetical protein
MAEDDPNVVTLVRPGEDHWSHGILGADGEALTDENADALGKFESQQDFANQFFTTRDADWRAPIAGDDGKFLSTLQRYNTPGDLGNAFREQRQTISTSNIQKPLGDNPTDEDVSAFREANGIPAEPTGYFENLPDGLVVGEDDKAIFEDFAGSMHEANVDPSVMHKVIGWYNNFAEQQQEGQAELDVQQSGEATDALRSAEAWGSDFRANINLVNGLIATTFGEETAQNLLNGRYQDGRAFMNDPAVLTGLAVIARKLNPIMELSSPNTDHATTLNDEIAELEKYMREERTKYNADAPSQERLRQLYDIRIKHEAA